MSSRCSFIALTLITTSSLVTFSHVMPTLYAMEVEDSTQHSQYRQMLEEWTKPPSNLLDSINKDFENYKNHPIFESIFAKMARMKDQIPDKDSLKRFKTQIDPYIDSKSVFLYGNTGIKDTSTSHLSAYCAKNKLESPPVSIYNNLSFG